LNIKQPLVSVCIPAYNAEQTIGKTLDSIIRQDYKHIEIIVSDNHSTDNTATIVKKYEKYNVKYFLNPTKPEDLINTSSVVSNFNHAISLAKGELIAIYHADDIYLPTIIDQQVRFFQENDSVGSVFTSSSLIDEDDNVLKINICDLPNEILLNKIIDFDTLLNSIILSEYHLMFPTLMIRSKALLYVGNFNPKESYISDIEYYLRLARWKPIGLINEKLHYYRTAVGKKNNSIEKKIEIIKHYIRFIDEYIMLPEIYPHVKISSVKFYEMLICSRKIFLARHYFLYNKKSEARSMLESFKYEYLIMSWKKKKGLQAMLMGLILIISDKFGIATFVCKVIEKLRHYRYILWHKSLY
jgi:glycosyltransferase involved in cell wall biosynthesis